MGRNWLVILAMAAALAVASPVAGETEVIVHPDHATQEVSRALLRGIFGMRVRAWPGGQPVHVFVLADESAPHDAFTRSVLRMYPYQLRQNWDRLAYSGTGQPPNRVSSLEEMRRRVAETPGAIGYLDTALLDPDAADVKVLHVR
jgi:ABC-type phosphate transport system substrate-binding protein